MCLAVIAGMVGLTFHYTGLIGLLVLATATAIGLLPAAVGVRRTHCMGVIMVPCILYFAGLKDAVLAGLGL
jgi:putative membrane protein